MRVCVWGGDCLEDDSSFEEKEKHQSTAALFPSRFHPQPVTSEGRVFDMRVNNMLPGKRSVCVFTAPRAPR